MNISYSECREEKHRVGLLSSVIVHLATSGQEVEGDNKRSGNITHENKCDTKMFFLGGGTS